MESTLTQHCEDVDMTVKSPPRNRTVRPQEEMRSEAFFPCEKDRRRGSVSVSLGQPQMLSDMHVVRHCPVLSKMCVRVCECALQRSASQQAGMGIPLSLKSTVRARRCGCDCSVRRKVGCGCVGAWRPVHRTGICKFTVAAKLRVHLGKSVPPHNGALKHTHVSSSGWKIPRSAGQHENCSAQREGVAPAALWSR